MTVEAFAAAPRAACPRSFAPKQSAVRGRGVGDGDGVGDGVDDGEGVREPDPVRELDRTGAPTRGEGVTGVPLQTQHLTPGLKSFGWLALHLQSRADREQRDGSGCERGVRRSSKGAGEAVTRTPQ